MASNAIIQAPIAIIGGGPGGLTLARLLEVRNIKYVLYERDITPMPSFINQGGTLDIRASSGQLAIKEAQLFDKFKSLARWDGSRVCMQNPSGTVKAVFGEDRDAPEIDRLQLREMLLGSIPAERIRWGHSLKYVEKGKQAMEHVLHFTDGSCASGFRLIVGADGAWSKVRPLASIFVSTLTPNTNPFQLTSAKPEYSGKVFIEGSISCDNPCYALAVEDAGPGMMMAMGEHRMLAVQQLADLSYRFYMGMDRPEGAYNKHMTVSDTENLRHEFLTSSDFFASWAAKIKVYLQNAEGPFHAWPLYRLPISSLSWDPVSGIALLGDAAHVSTPLVGEGVNMAMFDALMLSRSIVKCQESLTDDRFAEHQLDIGLREYEEEMLERGRDYISRCVRRESEFFSENAAEDFIKM
ncbi:hypothetical protein ACLX1H_005029 [Fusarium chlamydosporum]